MKDGNKRFLARLAPEWAVLLIAMAKDAGVGPHTLLREIVEHVLAREHLRNQVVNAIERRNAR